jgi:DNA-binding transcriptional regulator YiaG
MAPVRSKVMNTTEALLLSEVRSKAKSGEAKRERENRNLSRSEVAAVVGVTESTIFRWESGQRCPRGAAGLRYGRFLSKLGRRQ